jgi:hypothetical protein
MKKTVLFISFLCAAIFMSSCTNTGITTSTINQLEKGISHNYVVNKILVDDLIIKEIVLDDIEGSEIIIDMFIKQMGEEGGEYLLAFADGKLVYFGYPWEFAVYPDKFINEIGKQAMSRYYQD